MATVEQQEPPLTRTEGWPRKYDLFGVGVSATTYDKSLEAIVGAAKLGRPAVVSLYSVHALVTASSDKVLREKVNEFAMVAPDGQPVRWALNRIYGVNLPDRVYGPELMLRLCQRAARDGLPIYLYGGNTSDTLRALEANLRRGIPNLQIAGRESPPFRPLSTPERDEMVDRVNSSGAAIMFIGLGCPKQDHFAADHADRIQAVQVCVGAAFDFHAGQKKMAPRWMQRRGLEWLFRLSQEPRRLWRRYLVTNSVFVVRFAHQWAGRLIARDADSCRSRSVEYQDHPGPLEEKPQ